MPDYGREVNLGFPTNSDGTELKRIRRALEILIEDEVTPEDVQD
jgi:hypothetical protein